MKKIAVYTAIFGDKDELKPQQDIPWIDYICFTDNFNLKSTQFRIISASALFPNDATRSARIFKVLPHLFLSHYDIVIWIDGSVTIKHPALIMLATISLRNTGVALLRHPDRMCVYDELAECVRLNKDDSSLMESQVNKYRLEGYPADNGLVVSTVVFRRNKCKDVVRLNNFWWQEICDNSRRDQLSFNYVCWKHGIAFTYLNLDVRNNEYFQVSEHLR